MSSTPHILAQVLWQAPALLPAAIAALALLLAVVLWLYPPQIRALPPGWRWMPPLLRAMAVTALALSIIQPAVLRLRTPSQQGAVSGGEVWVDNSGYGELGFVSDEKLSVVSRLPGWTRGLSFHKDIAFVGTSRVIPRSPAASGRRTAPSTTSTTRSSASC